MTELQRYLAEEVAEDHADGIIDRREALRRLALLGLGMSAASSLLAAFARTAGAAVLPQTPAAAQAPVATVPTRPISFRGPQGRNLLAAWAPAKQPRGGVLVIHEIAG